MRGESPKNSLRDIFAIILSSPSFLYISEKGEINKAKRLSDIELASRLSYFLWGRPPDNLLMSLAKKGMLSDQKVLLEQTKRMLESNKINGFIEPFLDQWLHLDPT